MVIRSKGTDRRTDFACTVHCGDLTTGENATRHGFVEQVAIAKIVVPSPFDNLCAGTSTDATGTAQYESESYVVILTGYRAENAEDKSSSVSVCPCLVLDRRVRYVPLV